MDKPEVFYKLILNNVIGFYIDQQRAKLRQELYDLADDPILLKRRFRMLSHLAQYESQITKKIYYLCSDSIEDYENAVQQIIFEIGRVSDRSG